MPAQAPHRSGLAQLTHPALQATDSLSSGRSFQNLIFLSHLCLPSLSAGLSLRDNQSSVSPSSFTPTAPQPVLPFAPQGPFRSVPLLHRYYGILRVLDVLFFRRFIVFTFRDTATTFPFSLQKRRNVAFLWPGLFGLRLPQPCLFCGNIKTSQVPGEPPCAHALLYDRGGLEDPAFLRSLRFCLPFVERRRLPQFPFRGSITRPAHSLFTLCGNSYPLARTKLGSDCWPALSDRIVYLLGSITKFQLLHFLLVQVSWRTPRWVSIVDTKLVPKMVNGGLFFTKSRMGKGLNR